MAKKKDELSQMLKQAVEGLTEEVKGQIPSIDLIPDVSDADIKKSILGMTEAGWQKLYGQFGQGEVIKFINDFTRRRRF